jgi:hypothetical protein
MKGFIQTLKNIWSLQELRDKIIVTLSLILVYRFASYISVCKKLILDIYCQSSSQIELWFWGEKSIYYSLLFITLKIDFSEDNKSLEIDL